MVAIPPQFSGVYQYIANLFQIRPEWLVWPNLLTVFLWPLVLNIFMFYFAMQKMLRIFPSGVNMVIAGIIAFLALPFNQYTMLAAPLVIGIWGISGSGGGNILLRIFVIGGLYALTFFVLPWVTSLRL